MNTDTPNPPAGPFESAPPDRPREDEGVVDSRNRLRRGAGGTVSMHATRCHPRSWRGARSRWWGVLVAAAMAGPLLAGQATAKPPASPESTSPAGERAAPESDPATSAAPSEAPSEAPSKPEPSAPPTEPAPGEPGPITPPNESAPTEPPGSPEPPPIATSSPPDVPAQGCVLSANVVMTADTPLYDARVGGAVIGKFTGAEIPVKVGPLSGDPRLGRVRVTTAGASPQLRLEGWVDWSAVDTYAAHDLPLADRHVWITSSQPVRVVEARPTSLTVEYAVPGSSAQLARASAPCTGVALVPHLVAPVTVPERARTYQMRTSTLELYDEPNGRVVFTLRMQEDARQVFWSSAARGGFVQLLTRGGLTITAWARGGDLVALRRGEAIMQDVPRVGRRSPRGLALENGPQPVTVRVDLPIRAKASDTARLVGVLEAGATVYPMERVSGWVNVLPVGLAVMPDDGGGFWVASSEVR